MPSLWMYAIGGLALLLTGTAAGAYGAHVYYTGEIAQIERTQALADAARANADLKQFQDISKQINAAAQDFLKNQTDFGNQIEVITKDLKNVQAKTPLPRNCRPSADRVRVLISAIAAANSTISR